MLALNLSFCKFPFFPAIPMTDSTTSAGLLILSAALVSLGTGTPYLYSFWAPQFISQCQINAGSVSTLSYSLNIGSCILGPLAGYIVDQSPKVACAIGSGATLLAYIVVKICYDRTIGNVPLISFALARIGFGSVAGFYAAVKCCTAMFPRNRGSATAIPIAMYALSAMIYSTIGTTIFKQEESKFFVFLILSCPALIAVGATSFVMPETKYEPIVEDSSGLQAAPVIEGLSNADIWSKNMNLNIELRDTGKTFSPGAHEGATLSPYKIRDDDDLTQRGLTPSSFDIDTKIEDMHTPSSNQLEITIKQQVLSAQFFSYYLVLMILQGFGQMYIYSVGFLVTSEVEYANSFGAGFNAETIQSIQVTILSLFSFLGRLTSGTISDFLVKRWQLHRLWNIAIAAFLAIIASLILMKNFDSPAITPGISAAKLGNLQKIYLSSLLIGLMFGIVFGTFPLIVADTFSQKHYSTIWGLLTTGGFVGVRVLSNILSSNMVKNIPLGSTENVCTNSTHCYQDTFKFTASIVSTALVAIFVIIYKHRRY